MAERIGADDFFAGLFAALAEKGLTCLSIRIDKFDPVVEAVYRRLSEDFDPQRFNLRFRIRPHPIHGDSLTIQSALARAAQRDLISFDNPEYQDIRIKLDADEAHRILNGLPGGPDLYAELAKTFVDRYSGTSQAA